MAQASGDRGILICGTGIGIGIAASKVKGIRVCTCSDVYSAELSKRHNNSNILTMGARVVRDLAKMIATHWLTAEFEGGRHQRCGRNHRHRKRRGAVNKETAKRVLSRCKHGKREEIPLFSQKHAFPRSTWSFFFFIFSRAAKRYNGNRNCHSWNSVAHIMKNPVKIRPESTPARRRTMTNHTKEVRIYHGYHTI